MSFLNMLVIVFIGYCCGGPLGGFIGYIGSVIIYTLDKNHD
jgi:hypothetical protein